MADDKSRFMGMDEAYLRLVLANGGVSPEYRVDALRWLAQRDREASAANEASQAAQARYARTAKTAAIIAAIAAVAAIPIAIIASVISYLAWVAPAH